MPQQLSSTAKDALTGVGIGSVAGLLSTLFKKKRTINDFIKRTLIGGGVGAVAGVGLGGLTRNEPSTLPPTSGSAKPKLNPTSAALAGLLPGIGPTVYGAAQSADGDRTANALKLGLSSLAGGMPGGYFANMAAQRGTPGIALLSQLLTMAGSAGVSGAVASNVNKSASTLGERFQQGIGSFKAGLNKATVQPYNTMSSAALGMIPGAVLGGGVGLIRSALDSEDDGVMTTLGKMLSGAGVGGIGGAALFGGLSSVRRNELLSRISNPKRRAQASRVLQQFEMPIDRSRSIDAVNALAGADQIASPTLVRLLHSNKQQPNERR